LQNLAQLPKQVRRLPDGRLALRRHDAKLEKWLDENYIRCDRALYWADYGPIWSLKNTVTGECNVVGKGPSLDTLTDFGNQAPVFCINEVIDKIETLNLPNKLYSVRKDVPKGKFIIPKRATVITIRQRRRIYEPTVKPIYFNPLELQLPTNGITAICIMKIAKLMGFTKLNMFCFDAIRGITEYAKCIGMSATTGGKPSRFLSHAKKITSVATADGLELVWK
jgi:hypothetical protein